MSVLKFSSNPPKTECGMRKQIKYVFQESKTNVGYFGGQICNYSSADSVINDFIAVKEDCRKTGGVQTIHFIQAFDPRENISYDTAKEIAQRTMQMKQFKGFQMVYTVHHDKDHVHTHFILNSVNAVTEKKWHQNKNQLKQLKKAMNTVFQEFGISPIVQNEKGNISTPEYQADQHARSWKGELYFAIVNTMYRSLSREDFIVKMEELGYQVNWEDDRKYILFESIPEKWYMLNEAGQYECVEGIKKHRCRNNKLYPPEKFTKEALEEVFENNQEKLQQQELRQKQQQEKIRVDNSWRAFLEMVLITRRTSGEYAMSQIRQQEDEMTGQAIRDYIYHYEEGSLYNKNLSGEMNNTEDMER